MIKEMEALKNTRRWQTVTTLGCQDQHSILNSFMLVLLSCAHANHKCDLQDPALLADVTHVVQPA